MKPSEPHEDDSLGISTVRQAMRSTIAGPQRELEEMLAKEKRHPFEIVRD